MVENEILLAVLILCQTVTISVLCSYRWCFQQLNLWRKFPAQDYPFFYVFDLKTEKLHVFIRAFLDFAALVFVCLFVFDVYETPPISTSLVWAILSAVQILPSMYSLAILFLSSKRRRAIKTVGPTNVSIVPRSLFDYLPLTHFLLIGLSFAASLIIIISNESIDISRKLGLVGLLCSCCALLAYGVFKTIYGAKTDKLIADNDRAIKRKEDVQRNILGIMSAIFIFSLLGMQESDSSSQSLLLIPLSLYLQITIFNRNKRWSAKDMHVYKNHHTYGGS